MILPEGVKLGKQIITQDRFPVVHGECRLVSQFEIRFRYKTKPTITLKIAAVAIRERQKKAGLAVPLS